MEIPKLVMKRTFDTPREKLFEAWTNPEMMREWFFAGQGWSSTVASDAKIGGGYKVAMHGPENTFTHEGTYRELNPPSKIVFSWNSPLVNDTIVTIELAEVSEGTELTLTHELLGTEELRAQHTEGWTGCLGSLGVYVEKVAA